MLTHSNQPARSFFRKLTDARQICIRQMAGGKTTRLPGDRHVTRDLNISPAELVSLMFTSSDSIELLDKRIDCPNELTLRSLAREAHHERLEQVLGTPGRLT